MYKQGSPYTSSAVCFCSVLNYTINDSWQLQCGHSPKKGSSSWTRILEGSNKLRASVQPGNLRFSVSYSVSTIACYM